MVRQLRDPRRQVELRRFVLLDELSKERVRDIIEEAAAKHAPAGTPEQKIGDYYATFMDEAAIEATG